MHGFIYLPNLQCLVEAMNLVHEQNRVLATRQILFCLIHGCADVLDAREYRRQGNELAIEGLRRQARQRGLAHTRRPPKNHRVRPARLKRQTQWPAFSQQVRLPDHIGQLMGTKRLGQRWRRLQFEQIRHGAIVAGTRKPFDKQPGPEKYDDLMKVYPDLQIAPSAHAEKSNPALVSGRP